MSFGTQTKPEDCTQESSSQGLLVLPSYVVTGIKCLTFLFSLFHLSLLIDNNPTFSTT